MRVIEAKCVGCGACVQACPFGAIEIKDGIAAIGEDCRECSACINECPSDAIEASEKAAAKCDISQYKGYWVVGLESEKEAGLAKVTLELLSTARRLADKKSGPVVLVVMAEKVPERWQKDAASVGCGEILCLKKAQEGVMSLWTDALVGAAKRGMPEVILFPAVADGRDLAPKIACRLQTGLTADCTDLKMGDDGNLLQIRPTYGGNIIATIRTPDHRPQMASVRPNVMDIVPVEKPALPVITYMAAGAGDARVRRISAVEKDNTFQSLDEAEIILAGGYGLGKAENFQKLCQLAARMNAAIAASRKAVDAEWAEAAIQVGQTGKTVRPKLYIAFGISGALQHTLGMNHSGRIIAVNNDPAAPIMKMCDLPILADAPSIIDKMLQLLDEGYSPLEMVEKL